MCPKTVSEANEVKDGLQLRRMVDPFALVGEAAGNSGSSAIGTFRLLTITTNLARAALITSGLGGVMLTILSA